MPDGTPDPMLTAYLAGRHVPCPQCGYDLRDSPADRCPECGDALALRLGLAEPRIGTLVAGLIGLSAGAGLSGLLLVYLFIVFVLRSRGGGPAAPFVAATGIPFVIEAWAVVLWLRYWRRTRRATPAVRWSLVGACWALTLTNVVVFSFNIH